jgi:hypothetical protein
LVSPRRPAGTQGDFGCRIVDEQEIELPGAVNPAQAPVTQCFIPLRVALTDIRAGFERTGTVTKPLAPAGKAPFVAR